MKPIDLRSDTVTHPTPAMRAAMSQAPVGDDVYGEDPTVNRLQELAASLVGKEAALYVPSGTMGNLASILAHCQRGDEVMLGDKSHTFLYEAGGISVLGGIHSRQLTNQPDGSLLLSELEEGLRGSDSHFPPSRLVCLENTHNRCGGTCQTPEYFQQVSGFAGRHGLKIHLDGARIFNAAAAQNVDVTAFAQHVDSLTFCLSKGLAAPVGSVVCGTREFIQRVHRQRKLLGGGMRQAGILAAAGIVALETMPGRLGEDHARARALAERLEETPGLIVNPPATNMIFLSLADFVPLSAKEAAEKMKARGVLVGIVGPRQFRLVTHYEIDDAGVARAASVFAEVLQA
ncbi:MAG: low-specificity L-threonine aldolase [Anaerolineales bacterium]|nr:low-specificity L-threonine aldolase [Anaerolineales bacterium]MCZ2290259.1 low-specificity L-threonine aldolase [Anaerolineales bacterium]